MRVPWKEASSSFASLNGAVSGSGKKVVTIHIDCLRQIELRRDSVRAANGQQKEEQVNGGVLGRRQDREYEVGESDETS